MRFYGVVDVGLAEAVELFAHRGEAEEMLAELLADEPDWEDSFRVEQVELEVSLN